MKCTCQSKHVTRYAHAPSHECVCAAKRHNEDVCPEKTCNDSLRERRCCFTRARHTRKPWYASNNIRRARVFRRGKTDKTASECHQDLSAFAVAETISTHSPCETGKQNKCCAEYGYVLRVPVYHIYICMTAKDTKLPRKTTNPRSFNKAIAPAGTQEGCWGNAMHNGKTTGALPAGRSRIVLYILRTTFVRTRYVLRIYYKSKVFTPATVIIYWCCL